MELLMKLLMIFMFSSLRKNEAVKGEYATGQGIAKRHYDSSAMLGSVLQKFERHVVKGGVQTS